MAFTERATDQLAKLRRRETLEQSVHQPLSRGASKPGRVALEATQGAKHFVAPEQAGDVSRADVEVA
jgi:hypothetical protein